MKRSAEWQKILTPLQVPLHIYRMPHSNSVACGVLINVGARDERWPEEAGLAHALEHMLFQGTVAFPSAKLLNAYIEDTGGELNAWTNSEQTFFFNHVPADELGRSINILAEQMMRPIFPAEKIETEMKAIVQEIRGRKDEPIDFVIELADKALYGDHPLGWPVCGTEETVLKFTRNDFFNFHHHYYQANNFDFIIAGKLPADRELIDLFLRNFENLESTVPNHREISLNFNRLPFKQEKKSIEQVHIVLIAPNPEGSSRDTMILGLFATMIGGGTSFPLFVEVRDKLGLCYSILAHTTKWSDISTFLIYTATSPDCYDKAIEKIFEVINKSKQNSELLERTKKRILGKLSFLYDNPVQVIGSAAKNISLTGRAKNRSEIFEEINSISIGDIARVVNGNLNKEQFTKVFLTPQNLEIPTAKFDNNYYFSC